MASDAMDKIASLCKRRGFVFQSSEIYGGINACWDYGPAGVELKRNVKDLWWRALTQLRDDIEGLDSAILMHPKVWHASGHVESFTDPMVDCRMCKARFRADQLDEAVCPTTGRPVLPQCAPHLTEPRAFNLMFKTFMGPVEEASAVVYLRPETAQGIYVNFQNVLGPSRQKVPFGIAQIGKAFRNEISPGNFIFRSREFEQMEMQFFVPPGDASSWFDYWKGQRMEWYREIGIDPGRLRFHEHGPDELAHYAKQAVDIEYEFPFGWKELEGIHNRSDFDLRRHIEHSGKDLSYFDQESNQHFVPHIIETSAGADRTVLTLLVEAYAEEEERTVLRFHPKVAPVKVAVFPLVKRDGMPERARAITTDLRRRFRVFYDEKGAVGRRYRRQDEIGTPFCVTVDSQTLIDDTVTVRERDSMAQTRVSSEGLVAYFRDRLA
ncbi:MAG: glycine--tRNA ligase [Candidatus Eisenbacteria bacterium]|jgi:glycyl-tRNA synthetase|nr:glycine--tRNA ligase [Candidatus Eisenbacteria bacterium]